MLGKVITLIAALFCLANRDSAQDKTVYAIDLNQSTLEINVYREGFLKAFGHDHLIAAKQFSGQAEVNKDHLAESSVTLVIQTASLLVVNPGGSEKDRREVQATMLGEQVLDAEKNPEITFASTAVRSTRKSGTTSELNVDGILSLHGTQKPASLVLQFRIEDEKLEVEGETKLLQSDYGIKPIKAGGGTVRVKNEVKIRFSIIAVTEPLLPTL